VFIGDLVSSDAMPSLEATLRFAGARQRLLAHNIANWTTPDFRPMDVSPINFQKQLSKAIDQRREETGGQSGELRLDSNREVAVGEDGEMQLSQRTAASGILAQDRNNTDLERLMQDQAENIAVFRIATEFLRNRMQQIRDAIGGRA
jgi:flagellar basal-body rod protein FlgB